MKENMADISNPEGNPNPGHPNPPENRPENLGIRSTGLPEVDGTLGMAANYFNVREAYLSNPANKQAYDAGDQAFKEAINRQLLNQARSMGGIIDNRRGAEGPQPAGTIRVETPYGMKRDIEGYSETDMIQNIQKMRQVMINIESTRAPDGGDVNKESLTDLSLVINHLRKKYKLGLESSEIKKEDAKKLDELYQEFIARLSLHGLFLQFNKANDADAVNSLLSQVSKDEMNLFLVGKYKEGGKSDLLVWQALQLYEQNADMFLSARGTDIDRVRKEIKDAILPRNGQPLSEEDRQSAQIIAERLWSILGRRAVKDKLVDKEYRTEAKEAEKRKVINNDKDKQELDFEGDAAQGNFVLRRILSVEDWLISQQKNLRPYLKLFRNVDLDTSDFLSSLPGKIEDNWIAKLYASYQSAGLDNVTAKKLAKENAEKIATALTGIKKIPKEKEDKNGKKVPVIKNGKQSTSWPKNAQVDLSQIKWDGKAENGQDLLPEIRDILTMKIKIGEDEKQVFGDEEIKNFEGIDFAIFGENPLGFWAFKKIASADKARETLIGKTATFLRNPTDENLKPLVDVFSYQSGEDPYISKMTLIGNLVGFLSSNDVKERGYNKLSIVDADTRIFDLARSMGLTREDALKISKETLGDNAWDNLRIFIGYYGINKGIMAFIMELIKGMLTQGMNQK